MSEYTDRLAERCSSDVRRGVPFHEGMRHFTELIKAVTNEIEKNMKQMETYVERIEKMR